MSQSRESVVPLKSTFESDPDMAELVELFRSELPKRMETLQTSWNEKNWMELRRAAHQLRGASAGYGFAPIGTAAGEVEDQIRGGAFETQLQDVQQKLDELVLLCRRAASR